MTENDRLTHESAGGGHFWSGRKKQELIARLADYEDYGLSPVEVGQLIALSSDPDIKHEDIMTWVRSRMGK